MFSISIKTKCRYTKHIHQCVDCGKERLINYYNNKPQNVRCKSCATKLSHRFRDKSYFKRGKDCYQWKGGRIFDAYGYVLLKIYNTSLYFAMANRKGYVPEHRLIMAQYLGRCLSKNEIVHHRNGNRMDNRLENLELVSILQNLVYEKMCHNCELKKEIKLLRWQIKELTNQLQRRLILSD